MAEKVTRIRSTPGGLDSNLDPVPSTEGKREIRTLAVEPGLSEELAELGRDGERIEFTVYLRRRADVVNGDELLIRGDRYSVRVVDWRSPRTARGGLVALASLGRG
ncbi:hypothetical protein LRM64_10025 [Prescottella equi]|uniref:hypothetical protein n=1 Tax=Rhodococcus hoagii TaxID=43767 RepID=UPI0019DBCCED|nr:hypothetical protein [Prescottella equi]MCU7531883.1 hypothetical protein [Prescottella equi]MCU7534015.1 hypothetical protein [Prescottella equi]NKW13268.1 hypothetical protein [Prescottella equi]